ncbi:MAG: hypothetical protein JO102_06075, partial [Elusimicrobia bacterium]|nr:hypothetical protein [Elusimicrobiota bacterium]
GAVLVLISISAGYLASRADNRLARLALGFLALPAIIGGDVAHLLYNWTHPDAALTVDRSLVTVEASSAKHAAWADGLVRQGRAQAVIFADLPAVARARDLWRRLKGKIVERFDPIDQLPNAASGVVTIAAHVRGRAEIERRVRAAFDGGATAILVVSGGGLLRRWAAAVPGLSRLFPMDSLAILRAAREIRASNPAYEKVGIWAVANPYSDSVDREGGKLAAGADTIFLQPLFTDDAFAWLAEAHRRYPQTTFVAGLPMLPSSRTVRFWFFLIGRWWRPGPQLSAFLREFERHEREGQESLDKHRAAVMTATVMRLRQVLGWSNVHVMAMGGHDQIPAVLDRIAVDDALARLRASGISVDVDPQLIESARIARFRAAVERIEAALAGRMNFRRPARLRLDWIIPDGRHFEPPIAVRTFVETHNTANVETTAKEIAVNLRAFQSAAPDAVGQAFGAALAQMEEHWPDSRGGVTIGRFTDAARSLIYDFSEQFWRRLDPYMAATAGEDYRKSIGGSVDQKPEFVRDAARIYLQQLRHVDLADGRAPPVYLEIGAANAEYAEAFTRELARQAAEANLTPLLDRTVYVLAFFSSESLERSRQQLAGHLNEGKLNGVAIETCLFDLNNGREQISRYRGRLLRVHATNVFDSLPSGQIARLDGKTYRIESQLYLPAGRLEPLAQKYGLAPAELEEMLRGIADRGAGAFVAVLIARLGADAGYKLWADLWAAFRWEERYRLVPNNDDMIRHRAALGAGAALELALADAPNVRMPASEAAIRSTLDLLPLVHPQGVIEIIDVFGTDVRDFERARGPFRYDGSAMNYLNGFLFKRMLESAGAGARVSFRSLAAFGERDSRMSMEIRPRPAGERRTLPSNSVSSLNQPRRGTPRIQDILEVIHNEGAEVRYSQPGDLAWGFLLEPSAGLRDEYFRLVVAGDPAATDARWHDEAYGGTTALQIQRQIATISQNLGVSPQVFRARLGIEP